MQGVTLGKKEFYEVLRASTEYFLDRKILALILFGSSSYLGTGRDIDLLVVVSGDIDLKEKLSLEYKLKVNACRNHSICNLDVQVMSLSLFKDNLAPGSFLSGLALGYEIILDRIGVEDLILSFLKRLSEEKYVLCNRYGKWRLDRLAGITLRKKLKDR